MRALFLSFALLFGTGLTAQAQTSTLQQLATGNDARGWEAVGRIDIDGKGFCTGALIAPDLVLTAAHCMHASPGGAAIDTDRIRFLAGLRSGRPEATRGIRTAVIHPGYRNTGSATTDQVRFDLALLQLDRPIPSTRIVPFEVSSSFRQGAEVGVVSYAKDREEAPSLQEICNVLGQQDGVLIMDCDVDFGASGSPIFRTEEGVTRLVSVVSAIAEMDGEQVALGMDLAEPIATLFEALQNAGDGVFQSQPGAVRVLNSGQRNDTGALFVRP